MTGYKITQTTLRDGKIRYVAENDEGGRFCGVMTDRAAGPNTVLSDKAMKELSEQMLGKSVRVNADNRTESDS